MDSNALKIKGLVENKGQSCKEIVENFLKNALGVKKLIPMIDAYRKGYDKTMWVVLENPRGEGLIFSKTACLKVFP